MTFNPLHHEKMRAGFYSASLFPPDSRKKKAKTLTKPKTDTDPTLH